MNSSGKLRRVEKRSAFRLPPTPPGEWSRKGWASGDEAEAAAEGAALFRPTPLEQPSLVAG